MDAKEGRKEGTEMQNHDEKMFNTDDAAAWLSARTGFDIRTRTLTRWRQLDRGPHYHKIGGLVGYTVADLEAFLRDSRVRIAPQSQRVRPRAATRAAIGK